MTGFLDIGQQLDAGGGTADKFFIGKVVVNDDPKRLMRIKVQIPQLWDFPAKDLPWVSPVGYLGGCGTEVQQWIPETGTYVVVLLQSGDSHNPVYVGAAITKDKKGTALDTNYPHRVGWHLNSFAESHSGNERERVHTSKNPVSPAGHHWFIDRSTNDFEYRHPTGTIVKVRPDGYVFVSTVKTLEAVAAEDILLKAGRNIKMEAGQNIHSNAGQHIADNAPRIDHN